jgi:phosphoribosylaminoimidazole-succinocarboxamide synthase
MLPELLANRLIDTGVARSSALAITAALEKLFNAAGFQVIDICLMFDRTGTVLCGEISPDNMRIRSLGGDREFDKDLWRKNRPAEEIVAHWANLLTRLEAAHAPT